MSISLLKYSTVDENSKTKTPWLDLARIASERCEYLPFMRLKTGTIREREETSRISSVFSVYYWRGIVLSVETKTSQGALFCLQIVHIGKKSIGHLSHVNFIHLPNGNMCLLGQHALLHNSSWSQRAVRDPAKVRRFLRANFCNTFVTNTDWKRLYRL